VLGRRAVAAADLEPGVAGPLWDDHGVRSGARPRRAVRWRPRVQWIPTCGTVGHLGVRRDDVVAPEPKVRSLVAGRDDGVRLGPRTHGAEPGLRDLGVERLELDAA